MLAKVFEGDYIGSLLFFFFPDNYKAYITPHWGGLLKEELSDLEAGHIL